MIPAQIFPLCQHNNIPADCAECRKQERTFSADGIFLTSDRNENAKRLLETLAKRKARQPESRKVQS